MIDPDGPYTICPDCGYKHAFLRLPLLIISGASGTGKPTVCHHLVGMVKEAALLDSDILWRDEFNQPEMNHRDYFLYLNSHASKKTLTRFSPGVRKLVCPFL